VFGALTSAEFCDAMGCSAERSARRAGAGLLIAFSNRAANAVWCDRQSVSKLLCVILSSSIDAIRSFSPCRVTAHELCAIWQRIFWWGVGCGLLSRSLWTFSRHSGGSALPLEQSGAASQRLFRQQPLPLRRQRHRSVLLRCQLRLRLQHQQSVSE
jgi:hypothetical protein